MNHKLIIGSLLAFSSMLTFTGVTHADPPTNVDNTGWDLNPDVIVGGGSDTTYNVMQRLEVLYNGAPGCDIQKAETAGKGKCLDTSTTGAPTGQTNGNYDHDLLVSATPTGSGSGVDALRGGTFNQYTPAIDYARSSSGGNAARLGQLTYWGYARDAIAVLTFGTRPTLCISQAELQNVYSLAITNWNQLKDCTGASYASAPIIPWSMNTASGTYSTFTSFIAPVDPVTNGRKLSGTSNGPFENDIKPLLADQGPTPGYGADDDENNYIWWMSYAAHLRYPYVKNGCQDNVGTYDVASNTCTGGTLITTSLAKIGSTPATALFPSATTINGGSYPIPRTVYHVTRNTDADCSVNAGGTCNVGPEVVGADTGKGGAVREFTEWLCRTSDAQHTKNPVTGSGYRTEIVGAINAEGFQQAPLANGYRCTIQT